MRVDYGVENVQVCDAMVEARGEGRESLIAGPSTRNQRIEDSGGTCSGACAIFSITCFMHWKIQACSTSRTQRIY